MKSQFAYRGKMIFFACHYYNPKCIGKSREIGLVAPALRDPVMTGMRGNLWVLGISELITEIFDAPP
jgi:hypothetical protein